MTTNVEVKRTAEMVENLYCQLSIIGLQVRIRDGKVTWAKVTRANDSLTLGGEVELDQLYTVLGNVLDEIRNTRKGS